MRSSITICLLALLPASVVVGCGEPTTKVPTSVTADEARQLEEAQLRVEQQETQQRQQNP